MCPRTGPSSRGISATRVPCSGLQAIFAVVADPSTWKYAAFAGLIAAVVLNYADLRRGSYKMLDVTGIA